jgi:hypothetical protein
MNTVAILAVILGPAVGALGVFFGWLQSKGEREQSLALARTQQDHALALKEGQQSHEHRLRSGDRLFEKRGDLYVRLLGFLERQLLGVERTNPFMTIGPPQDPPGPEDEKEIAQLQAEVGVYGTGEVWQLATDLSNATREFYIASSSLDIARSGRTGETAKHWEDVQNRRQALRDLTNKAREQIQKEIETL